MDWWWSTRRAVAGLRGLSSESGMGVVELWCSAESECVRLHVVSAGGDRYGPMPAMPAPIGVP